MRVLITLCALILLSACAAPPTANQPANPPTDLPSADLQPANLQFAHLRQAACYYNRYHALAPDDLLGLKKLAEVCAALEDPSTGLRARAGVEDTSCRQAVERPIHNSQSANSLQREGNR